MQERVHGGRVELQGAAWRLSGIVSPIWLDVVAGNEIGISQGNSRGMSGHVYFNDDFDTPVHAILLDLSKVLATV